MTKPPKEVFTAIMELVQQGPKRIPEIVQGTANKLSEHAIASTAVAVGHQARTAVEYMVQQGELRLDAEMNLRLAEQYHNDVES